MKISQTFKRYVRSYKIETINAKDHTSQLEASKWGIEDFFKYLLDESKGSKNQIPVKNVFSKHKDNMDKWSLILFILTLLLKQHWILNMYLTNNFNKFCTGIIIGLMKDLVG